MLAIRLQRTGRSGHAQFRVIVQDDRFSPKSGRVVAYVGSYNPHTKVAQLDGEKISQYLDNGAQPSDRVAQLLKAEGIKLPSWVKLSDPQKRAIRNPEKLRRNRPAGEPAPAPAEEPTAEVTAEDAVEPTTTDVEPAAEAEPTADDVPAAEPETPVQEVPAEPEPEAEAPAGEPATQEPEAEPKPEETA